MSVTDTTIRDGIVEALNKKIENEFHILGDRSDGCILSTADRKEFTITVHITKVLSRHAGARAALIGSAVMP